MARAVSIHIGVNQPGGGMGHPRLANSEATAWKMAELANRAGYDSILVLRAQQATRNAVHVALTGAASHLRGGDTLLLSFSGHGSQVPDLDRDERDGFDETWCLADGELVDDKLAGYWALFEHGVRIVVIAESCYGGGSGRGDGRPWYAGRRPRGVRMRGEAPATPPSRVRMPAQTYGIAASVLMLAAATEHQTAQDGVFSRHLLELWDGGRYEGSYEALYDEVTRRVMDEGARQEPQLVMLGTADEAFPAARAFHVQRGTFRGGVRGR